MQVILTTVASTLGAVAFVVVFFWGLRKIGEHRAALVALSSLPVAKSVEQTEALVKAMNDHAVAMKAAVENLQVQRNAVAEQLAQLPALTSGLIEVTKAQVTELVKVQQVVKMLHGTLFNKQPENAFTEYSPEEADREYRIGQMVRSGMSRKAAEAQLGEAAEALWGNFEVTK